MNHEHIAMLVDYGYVDECWHFLEMFELDNIPSHFTEDMKRHIFYTMHTIQKELQLHLEARRVLVLSTAHVEQNTIQRAFSLPHFIADHAYGAYFYVGDVGDVSIHEDPEEYPADLYKVLLFAHKHGFDEVKFDGDADKVESLPRYYWQ